MHESRCESVVAVSKIVSEIKKRAKAMKGSSYVNNKL